MKRLSLIVILVLSGHFVLSQVPDSTVAPTAPTTVQDTTPPPPQENKRSFSEKFALGLGFGFWFNTRTSYFEIAPSVAYLFPKRLTTGIGYRYIYQHDKQLNNDLHSHGPNVFAKLDLLKRVYFWTEYEYLNNQYFVNVPGVDEEYSRETEGTESWFVGLGYQRSLGRKGKGGISVQVLYNILYDQDDHSPYYSSWIYRIGYFF